MKYGVLDYTTLLEMLDHDSLEHCRSHARIPYTFRIDHHDGAARTNSEARSFAALHSIRSKQQALTLKQ